jgi:DNA-binding transcriptional regulator YdaS (Cro superfamily)
VEIHWCILEVLLPCVIGSLTTFATEVILPSMSATARAISLAGGPGAIAAKFNINRRAVAQWIAADRVPAERCLAVEELCARKVTRYELRPDVFGPAPECQCKEQEAA